MDETKAGTLYGVSVGPGDPELLTLKAVRVLREADVIAAPNIGHGRQMALTIVADYIEGKELVDCSTPMSSDHAVAQAAYDELADKLCALLDEGKSVAFITIGDAGIYSTYFYVHERVKARGYNTEVVAGVPSFCAAAARLGTSLVEGPDQLLIVPVMKGDVNATLDVPATKVFMKSGREIMALKELLAERGELDRASMVANCGLEDEQVFERFGDVDEAGGYFSLVIVKGDEHD